jgi:glycosyltransferase involved in cell wall biosynthesis
MYKIGILSTHPIQYYSPLYRELAGRAGIDLVVYYAHRPTAQEQGAPGFGVAFEWDVPLLDGYRYQFLQNRGTRPNASSYRGCDTPEIAGIIERERYDAFLVHGWYTRSYRQAMRACWRARTPLMVRGDSTLLTTKSRLRKLAKRFTHRHFVPKFDAYLVVGQRAREYYLTYGADPKRMESSPHFVDNDRFARGATEAHRDQLALRAKWGLEADQTVFVFSGKFVEQKRPMDFIRAIAQAHAGGANVAGLMIGDGPIRGEIEEWIRSSGAPIRLTGFVNQSGIPAAYAAGDVLVLLSEETWGLVVNEGMACGLPAIVSDRVGCAVDLISNGTTGFVYPHENVEALAKRMTQLALDQDLLRRMSNAARLRVGDYSVQAAADGLLRAVQRISRRPSPQLASEAALTMPTGQP